MKTDRPAAPKTACTFWQAVILLALALLIILCGNLALHLNTALTLLLSAFVSSIFAVLTGTRWERIEAEISAGLSKISVPLVMFLEMGVLIGAWVASGTIPSMIYYGLQVISPRYFLPSACLISAAISAASGSSFGTVTTVGVALAGIGTGLNVPLVLTAGAIVTGAWSGNTLSPLSDSSVMLCGLCEEPMSEHIRYTMYTTVPSFLLSLCYFFLIGGNGFGEAGWEADRELILQGLSDHFTIHPLTMLPVLLIFVLTYCRKPVIPVFAASIALSAALACLLQGETLPSVMQALSDGYSADTGNALINTLIHRGGTESMGATMGLIIGATIFSAPLKASGCIDALFERLIRTVRSERALMLLNMLMHPLLFIVCGTYYSSYALLGEALLPVYERCGLSRLNYARIVSDTGVTISALVPWGASSAMVLSQLGVSALEYGRYAPFCWLCALFGLLYSITGIGIRRESPPW